MNVKIRAGYNIAFNCFQEVPMLLLLSVHPLRRHDLLTEDRLRFSPNVEAREFCDPFGNIQTRIVAPPGLIEIYNEFAIHDSGEPDDFAPNAEQGHIHAIPDDALQYLHGSRYCDTQKLSNLAWSLFGGIQGGWNRGRRFAAMRMIGSNSAIIMLARIVLHPKEILSALAFAETSRIWL
jgi:hypothetical protein